MKKYKMIDLFCGIGGFHLAAKKTGSIETVFASDIDPYPSKVYKSNFGIDPLVDITTTNVIDIPSHDILAGGFPCQPFSNSGNKLGFDDTRGTLFFDIIRIVEHHKPKVIFLENVKGLVGHDKGNTLKVILKELDLVGYNAFYKVLNTYKVGNIPQTRERIYIVAFRKDLGINSFKFPEEVPLTNTFDNYIDRSVKQLDKYYYDDRYKIWDKIKSNPFSKETAYQWRRKYVRSNKKNLCPTLTANMGTGGHNVPLILDDYGIRKLTPLECLKLQGFDSDFIIPENMSDARIYKQSGNSVSVPVIQKIFECILRKLNNC